MNQKSNQTAMLMVCLFAVAMSGCTGIKNSMRLSSKDSAWNPVAKLKEEKEKESPKSEPVTMVATWKGSTYEQAGTRPVNGFGGRIFFYDKDNNAVEADGELFVYGFDNSKEKNESGKADKKFVFRSTEFQTHKSDSGFGVSYSVWCPWQKVGGFRKTITLIPMFKTVDGRVLKGGQSINILHGSTPDMQMTENKPYKVLGSSSAVVENADFKSDLKQDVGVTQASFDGAKSPENSIKSATINLTPSMARRIATQNSRGDKQKRSVVTVPETKIEELREKMKSKAVQVDSTSEASKDTSVQPRRAFGAPGSLT